MSKSEKATHNTASSTVSTSRSIAALLPIMAAVFVAYLVIGVAIPVLPLHVHQGLGLGTIIVGLVAGCQFEASHIKLHLWFQAAPPVA
jgi:hypothetical protein